MERMSERCCGSGEEAAGRNGGFLLFLARFIGFEQADKGMRVRERQGDVVRRHIPRRGEREKERIERIGNAIGSERRAEGGGILRARGAKKRAKAAIPLRQRRRKN